MSYTMLLLIERLIMAKQLHNSPQDFISVLGVSRSIDNTDKQASHEGKALSFMAKNRTNNQYSTHKQRFTKTKWAK